MDSLAKDAGTLWLTIIISHYSGRYNNRYKVVLTLCFKSKQQKNRCFTPVFIKTLYFYYYLSYNMF